MKKKYSVASFEAYMMHLQESGQTDCDGYFDENNEPKCNRCNNPLQCREFAKHNQDFSEAVEECERVREIPNIKYHQSKPVITEMSLSELESYRRLLCKIEADNQEPENMMIGQLATSQKTILDEYILTWNS